MDQTAEFAFEKPKVVCIYGASLKVQYSFCNTFLTVSNLQQFFGGISDQVHQSKQNHQNGLVD